jgi:hypothetical protein
VGDGRRHVARALERDSRERDAHVLSVARIDVELDESYRALRGRRSTKRASAAAREVP